MHRTMVSRVLLKIQLLDSAEDFNCHIRSPLQDRINLGYKFPEVIPDTVFGFSLTLIFLA